MDDNLRLNYRPSRRYSWVVFLPLAGIITYSFLNEQSEPVSTIAFLVMAIVLLITPGFNYFCPELILSREGFAFLSSDRFTPYKEIRDIQNKSLLFKHTVFIKTSKITHVAASFFSRDDAKNFVGILKRIFDNDGFERMRPGGVDKWVISP